MDTMKRSTTLSMSTLAFLCLGIAKAVDEFGALGSEGGRSIQ
jgi:hypothetical protein